MPNPTAQVERLTDGRFRIILLGLEQDDCVSQAAVVEIAQRLCPGREIRLGRLVFTRQMTAADGKASAPARFEQEVACGAQQTEPVAGTATVFAADATTEAVVRDQATQFLDAYLNARAGSGWDRLAPDMRSGQSPETWRAQARQVSRAIGAGLELRIVKLSWYVDPPGVARGAYVAADFIGSTGAGVLVCGCVAMREDEDGRWPIVRVESGTLAPEAARSATPAVLADLKRQLRCAE